MKKMTICVVDDDSAYVYLLKILIRAVDSGIDIITFSDGDYAIDFMKGHIADSSLLPDLIFLDINMPRIDGWGFLDAYGPLAAQAAKQIPIYMLSSSISDTDISRARANPMVTDYIVKPLEEAQLAEILAIYKEHHK